MAISSSMDDRKQQAAFGAWPNAAWSSRWAWLAPVLAIVLFTCVILSLFWFLRQDEMERRRLSLQRDAEWTVQATRLRLQANRDRAISIARELAQGGISEARFRLLAGGFMSDSPEIIMVSRIDAQGHLHWVVPAETLLDPGLRNEGQPLAEPAFSTAFDQARQQRLPVYSTLHRDASGDWLLDLQIPVQNYGGFRGTVSVLYSLGNLLRHAIPTESRQTYNLTLTDQDGQPLTGAASSMPTDKNLAFTLPLDLQAGGLQLRLEAYPVRSNLANNLLLWVVVALSVFIIWSLWSLMRHTRRLVEAEAARDRLFDISIDILCMMDTDGRIVQFNPSVKRILGRDPEPLIGTSFLDLVHADDRAATRQELRRLQNGESGASLEIRCLAHPRGGISEERWIDWNFNPIRQGRRRRLLFAIGHDMTQLRKRQQALIAETAFRRAMENSMLTGMRAIDLQGRITYVNSAFCKMVDREENELIGVIPPYPYWPQDNHSKQLATLNMVLAGKAPASGIETQVLRRDGTLFDARMYVSPLIDANGVQTGWMTSMTDITEPKRIRQELAAAQERFTTVLEALEAAVSVYAGSEDGPRLLFANRYYKRLFGTDATGHRQLAAHLEQPAATEHESLPDEVFIPGAGKWFEVRQRRIQWVDGRMVHMQVATDITARKEAEALALQQQEKIHLTSRLITMGEMASSLAHELNQPLTAIVNYSNGTLARVKAYLERGETTDLHELLGALQKTAAQAERAGKIIRRIREFVKRSEPHRQPCSIEQIVEDAVGFAEIEAAKKRIEIQTRMPEHPPRILADPILIEQVLLNLLKNGIDAMQDAAKREVRLEVRDRGSHVEFAVTDHGCGIPPGQQDKLFDPFYSTKPEGMGMGLNICRSIIEFHHGRLWVENNAAGGCTFTFTLPKTILHGSAVA